MKRKHIYSILVISSFVFGTVSCNANGNVPSDLFTLPDFYNKTLKEAKLEVGTNILFETENVPTSELIEGRILSYANDLKAGDKVEKGTRVKVKVAKRSETAVSIDNEIVNYVNQINFITGPKGINSELLLNAGAGGTDLGIPFELPDKKMMLLYGDTFSGQNMQGFWNSNFMAITEDKNLSDGLTFSDVVATDNGMIKPFFQGNHQKGNENDPSVEVTKIPTGGISIGDDTYIFYMSIRYWGVAGSWNVNYNECLKATDNTYKNWLPVSTLRWTENDLYYAGQIYPFNNPKDPSNIYFVSIPGGRNNGSVMFRVNKDKFENRSEYEYLVGKSTWVKGDEGMSMLNQNPYYIMTPGVSEPSIMYSEYLDKFIYSTLKGSAIVFGVSENVEGPYKEIHQVLKGNDFPTLYGGFIHPNFTDSNGQRLYVQLSQWTPIYNTSLVEVVLK